MDKRSSTISEEQQEEFEQYLLGKLQPEDELSFNRRLKGDSKLRGQFTAFKELLEAIEEDGLRNELEKYHEEIGAKTTQKSNFNFFRIAAGIAILLALGIWFFNRQSPNDRLYQEFFTPDPGLPTVMGENDNYAFYEAMVDYKEGKYAVAIEKWSKLAPTMPKNDTLDYFLGVSHLANGDTKKSIAYLIQVAENKDSLFLDDVNLYLGLAFLRADQPTKARGHLAKSGSPKAKKLLLEIH